MVKRYPNLFGAEIKTDEGESEEETGDVEPATEISFAEHWGWLAIVDDLAKGDRTKWEFYLQMNIIEFLNEMAFRKDKQKETSNRITKMVKGATAEQANAVLLSYLANRL